MMRNFLWMILLAALPGMGLADHADLILRDSICHWETVGEEDRDDAVSKKGALGACQVRPGTADMVGFDVKNIDLMSDRTLNREVALAMLNYCLHPPLVYDQKLRRLRLAFRPWKNTALRLSYCYINGPWSHYRERGAPWKYRKQIAMTYTRWKLLLRGSPMREATLAMREK